MSANTIPDDVWSAAFAAWHGVWFSGPELIASAILAERQRCAAIVRSKPISETADRFLLECAILNPPSAASSRAEQTGEAEPPLASSPVTHTGFIATLTAEQKAAALAYRGDDTLGSPVPNLTHEEAQ